MNEQNDQNTQPKQQRKTRAKNGERDQKMVSFRLDGGLARWLAKQLNKGRYLNTLIARDMTRYYREHPDADELPDANDGVQCNTNYDYQP